MSVEQAPSGWPTYSLAARVSIVYALVAGAWIYASDALVAGLSAYVSDIRLLQTYKGWFFVAISALLLYGITLRTIRHLPRQGFQSVGGFAGEQLDGSDLDEQRLPWTQRLVIPLLIFCGLAIAIGLTGWLIYAQERAALERDKYGDIAAMADAKVANVVRWIGERREHARLIAADPFLAAGIHRWVTGGSHLNEDFTEILGWLTTLQHTFGYQSIAIVDALGRLRLHTAAVELDPSARARIDQALGTQDIVVSDLFRSQGPDGNVLFALDVVAPLVAPDPASHAAADALLLRVDAGQYLFPLVESWPTRSASAETELVRREGDDVLYLNAVRHAAHGPMSLRRRLDEPDLPPAKALRGEPVIQYGVDYRGVPVLAVARSIPGTEWILVAEIDAEEIYGPLRRIALATAAVVAIFLICAGAGIAFWWMQQRTRFLADRLQTRLERQALVRHFDYLSKYANDVILLSNEQGLVVEANARAEQTYGYPRDELIARPIATLYHGPTHGIAEQGRAPSQLPDGLLFEAQHQRRDGRLFPVEVSTRTIDVQGRKFQHSIVRDISERVHAERRARELDEQLRRVGIANELGQTVSSIAHELRQPLTAATNYVSTCRRLLQADPAQIAKAASMAVKAGEQIGRADHFVRDLRAFLQNQEPVFTSEDIRLIIEETREYALIGVAHLGIVVSYRHEEHLPPVRVDKIRIQQVVLNLIRNAVEAMSDAPRRELILGTRLTSPDEIEVSVTDTGCGLAPEMARRLFEAFVTTKPGGMGIGLSICRGIVEAHGGRLWAAAAPGGGTTFQFTLPVADDGGSIPDAG
jgi:two-component system sensor kinase FixL